MGNLRDAVCPWCSSTVSHELSVEDSTDSSAESDGVLGPFVAAFAAFAPSFIFIVAMFPHVARVRDNPQVRAALVGINAAVVGAILGATVSLAQEAIIDPLTAALAVVTFVLFVRGVQAVTLILGGGVVGIGAFYLL